MNHVRFVADTNVVSYIFKRNELGVIYRQLIGDSCTGITLLSIAELRSGVVSDNWGNRRIASLDDFLGRFIRLDATDEIANICGGILGRCKQIGLAMKWPDAWAAATAIWLGVPLVTHDRDLEGVPGLRVLTAHQEWRVREEGSGIGMGGQLWLGERDAWHRRAQLN
jgi:predicted nucleic acid-binding protein